MTEETTDLEQYYENLLVEKGVLMPHETQQNKASFLERYPEFGQIEATARAIQVGRRTVHYWLEKDKVFNKQFLALKKEVETELVEKHEDNIDTIAFSKETAPQSRIFGSLVRLRALAPDKYREKTNAPQIIGDIIIKMAVPPYNDTLLSQNVIEGEIVESESTKELMVSK